MMVKAASERPEGGETVTRAELEVLRARTIDSMRRLSDMFDELEAR